MILTTASVVSQATSQLCIIEMRECVIEDFEIAPDASRSKKPKIEDSVMIGLSYSV